MPRILAISALAFTLMFGCVPMIRTPIIEPERAAFDGVASTLMKQDAGRPLTVIWLHGMCSHFDDWAVGRAKQVAKLLGGHLGSDEIIDVPDTGIHIRRFELGAGGHRANLNYVVWSPLAIERKRDRLCLDSEYKWIPDDSTLSRVCTNPDQTLYFPHPRAKLNGELKAKLMNDCLADAVFYAGANGKVVRDAVRKALCVALTDTADCTGRVAGGGIALISESLGSRVLFDAVVCADAGGLQPAAAATRERQTDVLTAAFSRVTHLYLLANQLPILDLANRFGVCPERNDAAKLAKSVEATSTSALAAFLRTLQLAKRPQLAARQDGQDGGKVVVVAFTDPNDLLSYRLTEKDVPPDADAHLVNVFVSNAGTLLGFVEHPDEAHRGYQRNTDVLDLFMCGHPRASRSVLCR